MSHVISTALSRLIVDAALPIVDSRIPASSAPFAQADVLRPNTRSRRWSAVHYGIFVPDLPAPHRYVNTMTLIGASGAEIFDNDYLAVEDARDTATVLSSTAHADQHFYRAYDSSNDCSFALDGSVLKWGDDLQIDVALPRVSVVGRYPGFDVDLQLEVTDQASYFVKTPIYDHFSLMAPYRGVVDGIEVEGLGTFEYARMTTHQSLASRTIPSALKLPADFFTYQIIDLDDRTQVLLTDVQARGRVACRLAHLRTVGGAAQVFDDVRFEVLESGAESVDVRGRRMSMPLRFRWTVRDRGAVLLMLDATVDAPWRYGHGRGYVGAYSYVGEFRGAAVDGSGYVEWIDVRP
ncbi:hypothetical protein HH308_20390 [Gordonia sp. TBRC 11910]|uniref:AttH domain-containing protein n=1 Tax=Gordonia asplenii TaxID=2725283 RepID=A0A848KYX1_9ACTN|nr:DUF6670 family protein [Gordonia asplenii]NMO03579.1 hypothetical protein [Gordonia asplenii]